jgi:hypothetical protein
MMRIITWRATNPPPDGTAPGAAIAAFNELAAAVSKVSGVGDTHWGFGNGGIVTVSHYDNYAATDDILKDSGVQAAVIKVFGLGLGIGEDIFVASPQQVMPFLPQQ